MTPEKITREKWEDNPADKSNVHGVVVVRSAMGQVIEYDVWRAVRFTDRAGREGIERGEYIGGGNRAEAHRLFARTKVTP